MPIRKIKSGWAFRKEVYRVFFSKSEAIRFEAHLVSALARLETLGRDKPICCAIRDKLPEFLADRREGSGTRPCNENTAKIHEKRLKSFEIAFHSRPLDQIARADVEA